MFDVEQQRKLKNNLMCTLDTLDARCGEFEWLHSEGTTHDVNSSRNNWETLFVKLWYPLSNITSICKILTRIRYVVYVFSLGINFQMIQLAATGRLTDIWTASPPKRPANITKTHNVSFKMFNSNVNRIECIDPFIKECQKKFLFSHRLRGWSCCMSGKSLFVCLMMNWNSKINSVSIEKRMILWHFVRLLNFQFLFFFQTRLSFNFSCFLFDLLFRRSIGKVVEILEFLLFDAKSSRNFSDILKLL